MSTFSRSSPRLPRHGRSSWSFVLRTRWVEPTPRYLFLERSHQIEGSHAQEHIVHALHSTLHFTTDLSESLSHRSKITNIAKIVVSSAGGAQGHLRDPETRFSVSAAQRSKLTIRLASQHSERFIRSRRFHSPSSIVSRDVVRRH